MDVGREHPAPSPARLLARRRLALDRLRGRRPPPRHDEVTPYRGIVAYDGAGYAGWQRQRDDVSVQEMLEAALEAATQVRASVLGAGRTDAGVHAEGQVFGFRTASALPSEALFHLLLHLLPEDIRVLALEQAPAGFRPLRAARKLYRYQLLVSTRPAPARELTAWRVDGELDLDAMRGAAGLLVGEHDFRAFRNSPGALRRDEPTVRRVTSLTVDRTWDLVRVDVLGPGFLYMMVRNVVSALVDVGLGRRSPEWVGEVLASGDRTLLGRPAPAAGLTLVRVEYADGFGA